jgi:hypothetical protein
MLTRQRINTNLIKDFTCSGRELASRFQKLGSHLLEVLHFIPTALRSAEHNRFGEALSVRYQTQRPRRAAAGDTSSLIRTLTIPKRYAAGLEMSCPGGACYWAPEIPSVTLRPSRPDARADVNRFTIVVVFSSAPGGRHACQEAKAVEEGRPRFHGGRAGAALVNRAASPSEAGLATNSSPLTLTQRR